MSLKSEVMNISNGYIMEQMKIDDYDEIITLWRTELSEQNLSISDEKEYLAIMIEHNLNLCWVVKKNNHIIGTILGGWDGRRGYIHHLVVSKKYQGQKIGSILMSKVLSKFKEMKIPKSLPGTPLIINSRSPCKDAPINLCPQTLFIMIFL